jgi:hypothetical protein
MARRTGPVVAGRSARGAVGMTTRRDFPPPRPIPKLPQPLPPSQHDSEPAVLKPTPTTRVDELREGAERGTAGTMILDWEIHGGQVSALINQFTATGFFQREGRGPAGVSMVVGRSGRRILIEVTQPGRRTDPVAFEPAVGAEADISNPAVLARIRGEIDQLRQVANPLPMLVLLDPDVVPESFDRDRDLQQKVKGLVEPGIYVMVIKDTPGFQPTGKEWLPLTLVPALGVEAAREDVKR